MDVYVHQEGRTHNLAPAASRSRTAAHDHHAVAALRVAPALALDTARPPETGLRTPADPPRSRSTGLRLEVLALVRVDAGA